MASPSQSQIDISCRCLNCLNAERRFEYATQRLLRHFTGSVSEKHRRPVESTGTGNRPSAGQTTPPLERDGGLGVFSATAVQLHLNAFAEYADALLSCNNTKKKNYNRVIGESINMLGLHQAVEHGEESRKDIRKFMQVILNDRFEKALSQHKLEPNEENSLQLMLLIQDNQSLGYGISNMYNTSRIFDELRAMVEAGKYSQLSGI